MASDRPACWTRLLALPLVLGLVIIPNVVWGPTFLWSLLVGILVTRGYLGIVSDIAAWREPHAE